MSSQAKWRLLGALVIASVVLGVVGWQQFAPKPTPPTTVTITPAVSTVTGIQTIVVPSSTMSIRPGQIKPISYYLSLLESNGTQPCVQLAKELRKLPDLSNTTAVAKITYLALNATNPEVKESFELMIKGGTPDPRDFKYTVPDYNTELQVLYWLGCQNEFKKDDTLALAIAMVNGLWVTMGDDQVTQAVRRDTSALLVFFRETNVIQKTGGYYCLEGYPLEAKITLAWTGNMAATAGRYSLSDFRNRQLPLKGYAWDTISIDTLKSMRTMLDEKGWFGKEIDATVMNIEEFLFFSEGRQHWNYTCSEGKEQRVLVEGELVDSCGIFNLDWQFEQYLRTNRFMGGCADEASVVNAYLMSIGVANTITSVRWGPTGYTGHFHVAYYEPRKNVWKIYVKQLGIDLEAGSGQNPVDVFYLYVPPVNERGYVLWDDTREQNVWIWKSKAWYVLFPTTINELSRMFSDGVPTSQLKQWLLYS